MFDADAYLFLNPDVELYNGPPLVHFVKFGRAEKRRPHLLFDNDHYWTLVPQRERHMPLLIHYILFGKWRGWSPSPWFDPEYYVKRHPELNLATEAAYTHYVTTGHRGNLRPSAEFNPARYIREHQSSIRPDEPAIIHYLTHSGAANAMDADVLRGLPVPRYVFEPLVPMNSAERIRSLPLPSASGAMVDVIVPVYAAAEETLNCLFTVLSSTNKTPYRLIVVDDHSPEADLTEALRSLADDGYFSLVYHEENKGFVRSVNDGMSYGGDADVILLNSDTEVFGDWIDRLRQVAGSSDQIATVTPLTNNGTICGYPAAPHDNPKPLEVDYQTLDQMAWQANGPAAVPVPTAVGFCMYIKRAALNQVGLFDVEAFGRGYGEENDFCLRSQLAGWIDVAAPGVFVRHLGSLSFTGEKAERVDNAMHIINQRYPGYSQSVQEFLKEDPLLKFRGRLDLERLQRKSRDRNILIVNHARGGGGEQHVREVTESLEQDGAGVFRLVPNSDSSGKVRLFHQDIANIPSLQSFHLLFDLDLLGEVLTELKITGIEVHHTVDFGPGAAGAIAALAEQLNVPCSVMVHDYFPICPRINLIDEKGFYCGEPDEDGCNACLRTRGSEQGQPEIRAWRSGFEKLLERAEEVAAPSRDTADRIARYFPAVSPVVKPHEPALEAAELQARFVTAPVRIGILGAVSAIKGYNVILDCSSHVQNNDLAVQFIVVGYTEDDLKAEAAGLEVTGPYRQEELLEEVERNGLDLIFLPSVWPETYSYVLSSALQTGLPIAVFDIGAPAERLKGVPQGLILPLEMAKEPETLVKRLVAHAEISNVEGNAPS